MLRSARRLHWIPAFAGMTGEDAAEILSGSYSLTCRKCSGYVPFGRVGTERGCGRG